MSEYDRIKAISEDLKRIAITHNVVILTAVQSKPLCPRIPSDDNHFIFIDHIGLLFYSNNGLTSLFE